MQPQTLTEWLDAVLPVLFILSCVIPPVIVMYYRHTAKDRKQHDILRQIVEQLGETSANDDDGGVHHAEMVTHLVSFIHQTPCFPAKKKATEHLLLLVCTEKILEREIILQVHPTLVRVCMRNVDWALRRHKNRKVSMAETALYAWYNGHIPFGRIPTYCPPN